MALLRDIVKESIVGLAPTPVEKYAISTYFVNDGLFNLMEFVPNGMGMGMGNIASSYVQYSEEDGVDAAFRGIGEEYTASNSTPEPKVVHLKNLGGAYQVDRSTTRALKNGGMDVFREQQASQKANLIKNAYAKYFISGDITKNPKGFNGIYKGVIEERPEQEESTPYNLNGGLSVDNSIGLELKFNETIGLMNVEPNVVITTRKGAALAKTLNAYRNMFTGPVEIGDVKYSQLMGIPIIQVDESYFPTGKLSGGELPFIFAYIADDPKGIKSAIPEDGTILDIVEPELGDGVLVKTGAMEIMTVPIFSNPKSVAICYVEDKVDVVAG